MQSGSLRSTLGRGRAIRKEIRRAGALGSVHANNGLALAVRRAFRGTPRCNGPRRDGAAGHRASGAPQRASRRPHARRATTNSGR
ncbi:hypothetical protein F9948_20320 [Burkholderia thailandensis]|nr:hypothetical protein A8H32_32415 [Burkholderia thailandensis]MDD1482542.1 hypothetical protein [Burkholderia thailandensis]MDD1486694.1 hypothetical protein [Burkholderia thailandensis]MDD1492910.1 hypothetical protein [Burkholderia thailandensis]TGB34053.1 hypothetical protein C6946_09045 [Burkholderia thailandensis]